MDRGLRCRSLVALIAAYAVALKALLLAFVPAPLALADTAAVICAHEDSGGSTLPVAHDPACAAICAAIGHGVAGAAPPIPAFAIAPPRIVATLGMSADWMAPTIPLNGPHAPRGPPLA